MSNSPRSRFGIGLLGTGLLRAETSREGDRATTLELFFDLVYAFAFTQVTALMVHDETATGVLQALIVLALLWGPWSSFAWLANQAHADRGIVRVGMIVATVIMFFSALAVPSVYRDDGDPLLPGLIFATSFFLVQLVHLVVYLVAAGSDVGLRRQIVRTESSALLPAAVLLVVGAVVGSPWQTWIWLVAVVYQWVTIYLTSRGGDWRINSVAHFAERHGLVVLLALGESVIAIGTGVARLPFDTAVLAGSGLGFAIAVTLWWIYFTHAAGAVEHAVARRTGVRRAGIATDVYTYLHFPLIAGIVIAALGLESTIGQVSAVLDDHAVHESANLYAAFALAGGTALYVAGTAFVWLRVSAEWSVLRFGAAAVLLALIPVLAAAPALVTLALVLVVLLALAVCEQLLGQRAKVRSTRAASISNAENAQSAENA